MEMEMLKNAKSVEQDTSEIGQHTGWEEEETISLVDFVRMHFFIIFLSTFLFSFYPVELLLVFI